MAGRLFESYKHVFNSAEIKDLGETLARETQAGLDLEKRKSEISAELNAQIKATNGRCADLATQINTGFEMRQTEVLLLLNTPRPGIKQLLRLDNNEILKQEQMTPAELQSSFGFADPDEDPLKG